MATGTPVEPPGKERKRLILLLAAVYCYRIRAEERMLDEHFGDVYVAYKARTWRLVPFLW